MISTSWGPGSTVRSVVSKMAQQPSRISACIRIGILTKISASIHLMHSSNETVRRLPRHPAVGVPPGHPGHALDRRKSPVGAVKVELPTIPIECSQHTTKRAWVGSVNVSAAGERQGHRGVRHGAPPAVLDPLIVGALAAAMSLAG